MINDLKFQDVSSWKFVDDTTISEIVQKAGNSHVQNAVTHVKNFSAENRLQLNAKKCKDLSSISNILNTSSTSWQLTVIPLMW